MSTQTTTVGPFNPAAPRFTADQFTDCAGRDTSTHKARFANALVRLVQSDFAEAKFTELVYDGLMMRFGHCAEYNRRGFYGKWLSTRPARIDFLRDLRATIANGAHAWNPQLWGDVMTELKKQDDFFGCALETQQRLTDKAVEAYERALLRALKAKYEPVAELLGG